MFPAHRARDERGLALVEVLVSAVLLLAMAMATFPVLDSTDKASATTQLRATGVTLISQEQQRLRSLSVTDSLADYRSTRTVDAPVGSSGNVRTFTITSRVDPARDAGGVISCTTDTTAPQYLRTYTEVSWPGASAPVTAEGLVNPSPGTVAPDVGTLSVKVLDQSSAPMSGVTITAGTRTQPTNALGCAVFAYLPAGSTRVVASYAGMVGPDGSPSPATRTVSVVGGQTSSTSFRFGRPATLPVTVSSTNRVTGQTSTVTGAALPGALSLTNSDADFSGPRTVSWGDGYLSISNLFPFADTPTGLYAGQCPGNDPAAYTTASSAQTTTPLSPATTMPQVTVRMPAVSTVVQTSAGSAAAGARVVLAPDTSLTAMRGCSDTYVATADSAGRAIVPAPYGSYTLCAASGTQKLATLAKVTNTDPLGTAASTVKMTSYSSTQTC